MDEKKEHEALLEEWQERLGLHEWRITLNDNCHPDDMAMKNCVGCTDWTEAKKTARIDMLNPIHYGERIVPFDWECTHLYMSCCT